MNGVGTKYSEALKSVMNQSKYASFTSTLSDALAPINKLSEVGEVIFIARLVSNCQHVTP